MASKLAPIALFVFNRPKHVKLTIEALLNNALITESELFVFSDGAKRESDQEKIDEIRKYLSTIDGFSRITIIKRDHNIGLANSIISGVSEVLSKFDKIIILEDDMVTSPYFLLYMNEALEIYENEETVISVHGYVYPAKAKLPETFFLKGADCWGWGTWKRGWDLFESDGTKLFKELKARKLEQRFNFNGTYNYVRMLKEQIAGKNDSWAVRWYASALLNDKLTLYPGQSLVQNIGTDNSGIHCSKTQDFQTGLTSKPIYVERLKPVEDKNALSIFQDYFNSIRYPFFKRILRRFNMAIGC